jgi:hypothetical protein
MPCAGLPFADDVARRLTVEFPGGSSRKTAGVTSFHADGWLHRSLYCFRFCAGSFVIGKVGDASDQTAPLGEVGDLEQEVAAARCPVDHHAHGPGLDDQRKPDSQGENDTET